MPSHRIATWIVLPFVLLALECVGWGQPKPAFTPQGFINAASSQLGSPPAIGGLASLYGSFDVDQEQADRIPLPLQLDGLSIRFQGEDGIWHLVPLLFVSSEQVNLQIPWEVYAPSGAITAVVTVNGVLSEPVTLAVAKTSPAFFTFEYGPGPVVGWLPNWSLAHWVGFMGRPSQPVQVGGALSLLATGLGPLKGVPPETGANGLFNGTYYVRNTATKPRVWIGGVEAEVFFSALSPEFVGAYQVNVRVAEDTPTGDRIPIRIEMDGITSRDDVTVAVRK